jgi:hypothetical protein
VKIAKKSEEKGGIVMFCNYLSHQTCQILKERCFRLTQQSKCDFITIYYPLLVDHSYDPPLAQRVKIDLLDPIIQSFGSYAKNPTPGKKVMAARPFEKAIRTTLKNQLSPLGVTVTQTGKRYPISESTSVIVDCLAEKGGCPDSIFSMKTWIGGEQLRETFAYAYFGKNWRKQTNVKVYMVIFQPIAPHFQDWIKLCSSYIDGVYSLSGKPYIDDLLDELRRVYVQTI